MKKIKLDQYDLRLAINSLFQTRNHYYGDDLYQLESLIFNLIDICEHMGVGSKRIPFETESIRLLTRSLVEWKNERIRAGEFTDPIDELLIKIAA